MNFQSFRHRLLKQRKFRQLLVGSISLAFMLGVLIVPVERFNPVSPIQNYKDGLWWSVQTLTTVGYGDVVPVTDLGRLIGVLMQIVGAVMFGSLIAIISTSMSRRQEEFYWDRLFERLDEIDTKLDNVSRRTTFLVKDDLKP